MPPTSAETVLGLDNVQLELPIAGVATRILAGFLDYLLVWLAMAVWLFAALTVTAGMRLGFWWMLAAVLIGLFVVEYGYFAGLEILMHGQTFGKRIVGLRVVTRLGGRAGAGALLLRNTVRLVDLVAGVPLMAADVLARRLGDHLAGTLVVHERSREPEVVIQRVPQGWTGAEVALLESLFRRQRDLEPDRTERLAARLLAAIERDDPRLLDGVDPGLASVDRLRRALDAREG